MFAKKYGVTNAADLLSEISLPPTTNRPVSRIKIKYIKRND